MTEKSLKAFSISSFCIPVGTALFCYLAVAVNVKFLITAALFVYLLGWIPGLTFGIMELVMARRMKKNSDFKPSASVTVFSVLGIILNAIMLISICFVIYALAVEAAGQAAREAVSSALMKG